MDIRKSLINLLDKKSVNFYPQGRREDWNWLGSNNPNSIATDPTKQLVEGYESNIDVYSVIKKITDSFIAVPTIVERKTADGWELFEGSTIEDLLMNPNNDKGYTWNDIQEQILIYLLANGNSYMVGQEGLTGNLIREIDILPSPFVLAHTNQDFFMPNVRYVFDLNNTKRSFDADQIEHVKLFNPAYTSIEESFKGLSAIQVAARAVQVGNDRWDADASLLQNRGAIGLVTDKSNRPMTEPEAASVQQSFQRDTAGPRNFGKVKVTNKDLGFISMAMSSTDLQLVEKGVVTLRSICNIWGLDSSLFNDPANKTFNNRKEAEKALYTNAIIPISNKVFAKHNKFIALNHYPDGSVRMRQDFDNVEALQVDKKVEAEKDKIEMEGINIVLNMPISNEGKAELLKNTYDISEELVNTIISTTIIEDE